jgi:hypothetical protein
MYKKNFAIKMLSTEVSSSSFHQRTILTPDDDHIDQNM